MDFLLPAAEYDSIRDVLGLSVAELPSAVIERTPFLPSAEAAIKERVPDYAAIVAAAGDDQTRLHAAIVYLAAAKLCDRAKNLYRSREKLGDFTAGDIDWEALKAECLAEYEAQVGAISTQVTPAATLLTLAGVTRSVKASRAAGQASEFENI